VLAGVTEVGSAGPNLDLARWEYWDGAQWMNIPSWSRITGKPATSHPMRTATSGLHRKASTSSPPQWVVDGINTNGGTINDILRAVNVIHARLNRIGA
jgi:hypothetical protein